MSESKLSTQEPAKGHADASAAAFGYAATWLVEDTLDALNRRIHDGVPLENLVARAHGYRDWLFNAFPEAEPKPGERVMELGSGVGWIMQAMLERFPDLEEVVGLDISSNMVQRAQERFSHPRARFQLYDGLTMPFGDDTFDLVYSVAAVQHIEKHIAFLLFEEMYRVLKSGGHAIIHVLSVEHIPFATPKYRDECLNHIRNVPGHWHHYYSFDELRVLFSDVIGVTDFDVAQDVTGYSFLIHFGKGGTQRYRRPVVADWIFEKRVRLT